MFVPKTTFAQGKLTLGTNVSRGVQRRGTLLCSPREGTVGMTNEDCGSGVQVQSTVNAVENSFQRYRKPPRISARPHCRLHTLKHSPPGRNPKACGTKHIPCYLRCLASYPIPVSVFPVSFVRKREKHKENMCVCLPYPIFEQGGGKQFELM